MTCGVNRNGRVCIIDVLYHLIFRTDLFYKTEIKVEMK